MPSPLQYNHDTTTIPPLLEEVITAHGGRERWDRVWMLECRLRFLGRMLAMKFLSPRLRHIHVKVDARQLRSVIENFPRPGVRGVFSPLARGAHYTERHKSYDGLVFPTHRRVYVRGPGGRPLRAMTVLEGWVDDIIVHSQDRQPLYTTSPTDKEKYA